MPSKGAAGRSSAPLRSATLVFGDTVQRPAVVVSSRSYNVTRPDLIMMAVTSQLRPTPALGEVWLRRWQDAGLVKPSAVKPVFATLEQGLVIHQLGALAAEGQNALRLAIGQIIG